MERTEALIERFFKTHPEFLRLCQELRWAKLELVVKDGKPVMVSVRRDIKLE
ncbi:MAG: hypothetical protein Q8O40_02755 [Chloroflexota bacterium]|nr:hypothetical protein [Chloroflexota bacterium]